MTYISYFRTEGVLRKGSICLKHCLFLKRPSIEWQLAKEHFNKRYSTLHVQHFNRCPAYSKPECETLGPRFGIISRCDSQIATNLTRRCDRCFEPKNSTLSQSLTCKYWLSRQDFHSLQHVLLVSANWPTVSYKYQYDSSIVVANLKKHDRRNPKIQTS